MAHRPKKKSEFFNKGRRAGTPLSAEHSSSSPVVGSEEFQSCDKTTNLNPDNNLPTSTSKGGSVHPLNSENVVQSKDYQEINGHDGEKRNASIYKDYPNISEATPVHTPSNELTPVENVSLNCQDSNHFSINSQSLGTPVSNNDGAQQLADHSSRNGYAHNQTNSSENRDSSRSPDSDEIEIIEEYVNSHYNPRKRKARPDFYNRQNVRRAVVGYPVPVQPHHYPGRAGIRPPHHEDVAHLHSAYPHSTNNYNSHPRHSGPRISGCYNAEGSVLYTTVYEEHHTSVVNGSYPNHGTSSYKVVSSRYPNKPPLYSPEVTAPRPLYTSEISNGRYLEKPSNVHNLPYLTNGPSISNCRSAMRPNVVENSGRDMQSEDHARHAASIGDPYAMELGPRRPLTSSSLGLNSSANLPPPTGFSCSYDSLPNRKSAFVPVVQNARTAANAQRQSLGVPRQPNPRPTVDPPFPVPVSSEMVVQRPPEPCVEVRPEAPQPPSEKKRFQTCRLCHNHGIVTPIKGHKYVCPYNKCTCSNCKITLKRRHFVKEQLKITRRQNNSVQNGIDAVQPGVMNSVNLPEVQIKPFPQEGVMMKDLALFDDSDFFEEIDSICRPQGRGKTS